LRARYEDIELKTNENKKETSKTFLAKQKSFPIIEAGRFVHLVYRDDVPDAAISGDGPGLGVQFLMNQVAGSGFYHFSFELTRNAYIPSQVAVYFEEPCSGTRPWWPDLVSWTSKRRTKICQGVTDGGAGEPVTTTSYSCCCPCKICNPSGLPDMEAIRPGMSHSSPHVLRIKCGRQN